MVALPHLQRNILLLVSGATSNRRSGRSGGRLLLSFRRQHHMCVYIVPYRFPIQSRDVFQNPKATQPVSL